MKEDLQEKYRYILREFDESTIARFLDDCELIENGKNVQIVYNEVLDEYFDIGILSSLAIIGSSDNNYVVVNINKIDDLVCMYLDSKISYYKWKITRLEKIKTKHLKNLI